MSEPTPIIQFENVSKQFAFHRDKPQTVQESIISFFSRGGKRNGQNLWALQDIDFSVLPGESVGIIGRNGSGKSTALKLMTQILRPTKGRITVRGRVSALLELGAGFHPDLSGRDNIFLNAAVLGIPKETIESYYDDIVAFSELGDFINMPVKHYSSGMYMRLGFSVAIHVDPDVLIVDEILAVGDQAFQTKCLDRIHDMKRNGVTVIMVSHNLDVVRKICSRLIWLEDGRMRLSGLSADVAEQYQMYTQGFDAQTLQASSADGLFKRTGSREVEITAVRLLNAENKEQQLFKTGDSLTIEMEYMAHKPIPNPEFGLAIYRYDGIHINGPNNHTGGLELDMVEGPGTIRYLIDHLPLLPARYRITTAVHDSRYPYTYDHHDQAYTFRIIPGGTDEEYGIMELTAVWEAC